MKNFLVRMESENKEYKPTSERVTAQNKLFAWLKWSGRDKKNTSLATLMVKGMGYRATKISERKEEKG